MSKERRQTFRVHESRLITQIASEVPATTSMINLSKNGLYTIKPASLGLSKKRLVQMEIPLPEASETIWATGEIVFEEIGAKTIGSGIRFGRMAKAHKSLILDFIEYRRLEILEKMIEEILWRKRLKGNSSPYAVAPPVTTEDTVRIHRSSLGT